MVWMGRLSISSNFGEMQMSIDRFNLIDENKEIHKTGQFQLRIALNTN